MEALATSERVTIGDKVRRIIGELDKSFMERGKAVRLSLLAMLSGQHVLLLGPPGTAKSLLARTMCAIIEDGQYFDYLLTRFTTPDELFGPLSIKKLEQDVYERQTKSYLPTAHIAFLDEIFKANSSILNSLLTLINERVFHNGSQLVKVPLVSIFGASNETSEDETLAALYDRFLVRVLVNYVEDDKSFLNIVLGTAGSAPTETRLTVSELESLAKSAQKVQVPQYIQDMVLVLKRRLSEIGIVISDRRWKHLIGFLRTIAAASNRQKVQETDLLVLQDMIWDEPSQIDAVRSAVWDVVVAAENKAAAIKNDVKNTEKALEKSRVTVRSKRSSYGYDTSETEKIHEPLSAVDYKMYMSQVKELKAAIDSAKKKVTDRRRRYESQLSGNIWVSAPGLIDDVEKEMKELVTTDESLEKLVARIEKWPRGESPEDSE